MQFQTWQHFHTGVTPCHLLLINYQWSHICLYIYKDRSKCCVNKINKTLQAYWDDNTNCTSVLRNLSWDEAGDYGWKDSQREHYGNENVTDALSLVILPAWSFMCTEFYSPCALLNIHTGHGRTGLNLWPEVCPVASLLCAHLCDVLPSAVDLWSPISFKM